MCLCSSTIKPFSGWPLVSLRFATAFAPCKSLWKNASTQTRTKNDRPGGFFTLRPLVVGLTRSGGHLIFIYIYIYVCVCVFVAMYNPCDASQDANTFMDVSREFGQLWCFNFRQKTSIGYRIIAFSRWMPTVPVRTSLTACLPEEGLLRAMPEEW